MSDQAGPPAPHVLVVANSETTLTVLSEHLTQLGHIVAVAHYTVEVLAHSADRQWDAVVIDLTPETLALELVRELKVRQTELATIVLSSARGTGSIRAGLEAGAYLWLPAPCPIEVITIAVLRAYERRLLQRHGNGDPRREGISSAVAHTINNQLAGIIGLTQLHITDETLSPDLRADLEVILQSARALGDLLKPLRRD